MSLYDEVVTQVSLAPATLTDGTANGTAVDRGANGGMQDAVLVITSGAVTDGSHAVTVEDSADGSTGWTAVAAGALQGSLPTLGSDDDDSVTEVGLRTTRRYVRAVVATTGSTSGGIVGATFTLGAPRFEPVSR
ncbi:hypothetical protein [Streptomyces sp. WMMC897]|uniref:hypothetical protein n=1 Tax=Streptomyces sp. WMMC897 TaxID=3014782 RepID=UPI0022B664D8|nr:hypothetical protein [Streptomyces sp. WMMC897]MCZ7413044.1 hypothetical protein [Streptomyces sp. WMMC897]MCZ7413074.1 hypothetical protein [Streptomyces sp. WMMC897]MCZ7415454.1 hypothetical protein [Streptomyces sp. WMMC897]